MGSPMLPDSFLGKNSRLPFKEHVSEWASSETKSNDLHLLSQTLLQFVKERLANNPPSLTTLENSIAKRGKGKVCNDTSLQTLFFTNNTNVLAKPPKICCRCKLPSMQDLLDNGLDKSQRVRSNKQQLCGLFVETVASLYTHAKGFFFVCYEPSRGGSHYVPCIYTLYVPRTQLQI